jgi:hypothetical protein
MSVLSPELQKLARDVVKSKSWKWCEGMLLLWGANNGNSFRLTSNSLWEVHMLGGGIPDLSDTLTLQCILEIVRENRCEAHWEPVELLHDPVPDWVIETPSRVRQTLYSSYVSALIAALLWSKCDE